MMCTEKRFDTNTQTYYKGGQYEIFQKCNAIRYTNTGNDNVTVDGQILYAGTPGTIQGDSITIGGNNGEIYNKRSITVTFAGVGLAPALEVTQKYYIE